MNCNQVKVKLKDINPCGLSSLGPFSLDSLIATQASGLLNVGPLILKYCIRFEDFPRFVDFSHAGTSSELLDALDHLAHQIEMGEVQLETNAINPDESNQAKFNYLLMLLANGCLTPTCVRIQPHPCRQKLEEKTDHRYEL